MKTPTGQGLEKGKQFLKKYFMDGELGGAGVRRSIIKSRNNKRLSAGQKLEADQVAALASLPQDAPLLQRLLVKHRRLIGGGCL